MWIAERGKLLFFPYCIASEKVIQVCSLVSSYVCYEKAGSEIKQIFTMKNQNQNMGIKVSDFIFFGCTLCVTIYLQQYIFSF